MGGSEIQGRELVARWIGHPRGQDAGSFHSTVFASFSLFLSIFTHAATSTLSSPVLFPQPSQLLLIWKVPSTATSSEKSSPLLPDEVLASFPVLLQRWGCLSPHGFIPLPCSCLLSPSAWDLVRAGVAVFIILSWDLVQCLTPSGQWINAGDWLEQ